MKEDIVKHIGRIGCVEDPQRAMSIIDEASLAASTIDPNRAAQPLEGLARAWDATVP